MNVYGGIYKARSCPRSSVELKRPLLKHQNILSSANRRRRSFLRAAIVREIFTSFICLFSEWNLLSLRLNRWKFFNWSRNKRKYDEAVCCPGCDDDCGWGCGGRKISSNEARRWHKTGRNPRFASGVGTGKRLHRETGQTRCGNHGTLIHRTRKKWLRKIIQICVRKKSIMMDLMFYIISVLRFLLQKNFINCMTSMIKNFLFNQL